MTDDEGHEEVEEQPDNGLAEVPCELLEAVQHCTTDLHEADAEHSEYAEQAKLAKKKRDTAQEALNRAVDALVGQSQTRPDGFPVDSPLATAADDSEDAWRSIRLDELDNPNIKAGVLKAMAENKPPILTMGDLVEWQKEKSDFWAKDINGIGKIAQDSIAAATEGFWTRYNPAKAPTDQGE